jgi:hypothetical protein
MASLAAFPAMLELERKREGLRICRVAWLLGVSIGEYRELEAGTKLPAFDTWDRICKLYGWSQSFVGVDRSTKGALPTRMSMASRPSSP